MKAVVKYGLEDKNVELRDMPEPDIGPTDVLLDVQATGVCGQSAGKIGNRYQSSPARSPAHRRVRTDSGDTPTSTSTKATPKAARYPRDNTTPGVPRIDPKKRPSGPCAESGLREQTAQKSERRTPTTPKPDRQSSS